jgi:pSer/pThr/pTyr-binding forkhead associated (FHA) protein
MASCVVVCYDGIRAADGLKGTSRHPSGHGEAAVMQFRLQALDQPLTIILDKPILLVGRQAECDIQLESSKVSRRHCFLAKADGLLYIRDLESTNGLRVNGQRVESSALRDGDEVIIGNVRFKVQAGPAEGDDAATNAPEAGQSQSATTRPVPPDQLVSCDFPVPLLENKDRGSGRKFKAASGSR